MGKWKVDELLQNVTEDCVLTHHGDERVPFLGTKGKRNEKRIEYYERREISSISKVTHLSKPVMSDYAKIGDYVCHQYSAKLKVNVTENEVNDLVLIRLNLMMKDMF